VTEQEFRLRADDALEQARRELMARADDEGFELELQNGVLQIEFEEPAPAKFVVSPNAPMRQVWVSAMAKGYRLDWDAGTSSFALGGESLDAFLGRLITQYLG